VSDDVLTLTPREAARCSGLPRDYVYRSLHAGKLHAIRAGRAWRIPRSELEAFLVREARRRKDLG
jgi:excisionase family DNA binding protein